MMLPPPTSVPSNMISRSVRPGAKLAPWVSLMAMLAGLVLSPVNARAQAPAYRRAPGDTLRYREVTNSTIQMQSPSGVTSVRSGHDARIAIAFAAGDTARAWFEALSLSVAGLPGQADRRSDGAGLIEKPYTLVIGARGEVQTVRMPEFTDEVARLSDLSAEFTDFFPRLSDRPLTPGTVWTDTVSHETTSPSGSTVLAQRIGNYRVRGDTTISGERAVIVELATQSEIISGTAVPRESGATMRSSLKGEETGAFYFAPASGRLLVRRRTGRLSGAVTVSGGGQQIAIPQTFTYESRIELVR
jgi:hypothetical protein